MGSEINNIEITGTINQGDLKEADDSNLLKEPLTETLKNDEKKNTEGKETDKIILEPELPLKRPRRTTRKKIESLQTQIYQCIRCPLTFSHLSQLKSHAKTHLEKNSVKIECNICKLELSDMKSLISHRRQHHNSVFKCLICNSEYNHQTSFKIHMRVHRGEKPYVCKECGASFSQSGHLSIHKRTHTGEKPYTCDICSNNFKQISHLKTHVRTHTHDKPYRCNQCSAAFTQNSSLKRHYRVHTGEKPYKCAFCGMTFIVKSNMKRHLNTHTGEKPFQCDLCPASFGQAIDLKRHKISHTGVKPYECDLCDAAFSRKNNLKWHKLTHSDNTSFHCNICFVGFSSSDDLKAHKRNHAPPKPYTCDVCPAAFRFSESLNRHKLIHTGEKPLRLKTNKQNSSKNSKSKPFNCLLCNASFCEKRNLKRHAFSVHHTLSTVKNTPVFENPEKEIDETIKDTNTLVKADELTQNPKPIQNDEPENNHLAVSTTDLGNYTSNMQQVVMQNISTTEGINHTPQFLMACHGQTPKPARPAGQCQNHSLHILTFVDGSYNQWQSWCFCDPPNIPDPTAQIVVPSFSNHVPTENVAQILIAPAQSSCQEGTPQLMMTVASPASPENSPQIIAFNQQNIQTAPAVGSLSLNGQTIDLQGNIIAIPNTAVLKEVKTECKEWI